MLFSVVLCTYNRADRILGAIDRVLRQDWTDFELVVVDDGSEDDTPERLAGVTDARVRVVRQANGGLSAARNAGLRVASGRLVVFLDDDDQVTPGWLAGLASGVDDTTGFTACACTLIDEEGRVTTRKSPRPHVVCTDVHGVFLAGTWGLDRQVLLDVGGYAEDIRVSHQSELLLRALPHMQTLGMAAALVDEPLIAIERRDPGDRPLSQPADLLDGAEYLIDHHGARLAGRPHALANYHAIAGVSAAQLGYAARSRRHLLAAARLQPTNPRMLGRAAVSLLPPLAKRIWRPPPASPPVPA